MTDLKAYLEMANVKLNVYAMLGLYKRRSKLKPDIPDEVVKKVCLMIIKNEKQILEPFPYFLRVLKEATQQYFAEKEIREHEAIKKEPVRLKITIG